MNLKTQKMKPYYLFSLVVVCYSSLVVSYAQLTYQEITSGLNVVTFEGGETEIEVGDIDGDGDLDIVTIGDHGSPNINATEAGIMVFKNNGSGTAWTLSKYGNFGYGGVAIGDVNQDGKADVVMGMHHNYATSGLGSQMMEVAIGDGTGSNWTQSSAGLLGNGNWGMFSPDFGDINNDGLLDIVCTPFSFDDGFHAYKNSGTGNNWISTQIMNTGNIINYNCRLGDFNNDGDLDVMISCQAGSVFKGNGQGTFSPMKTGLPNDWTMKFAIADLDNNGSKDVAVVSSGSVTTYKYNGTSWVTFGNTNLPTTGAKYVGLADMDMDGFCDLLTFSSSGIVIYKGDGAGNWTANGNITLTINHVRGLSIADLNHDGYSDIVYFGSSGGNNVLKVFLHTGQNPSLNLLPEFPKGQECFKPGSVQFLKWLSSVPSGPNATVKIEFSSTGSTGPWTLISNSVPNSGIYQWVLPNIISNNCFLKYTITQGANSHSVVMSKPFGIGNCTPPTPTGMNEADWENMVSVFPNPSFGEFTVYDAKPGSILRIYDILGNKVYETTLYSEPQIVNLNVTNGIYFCEIHLGKRTITQKIAITK